MMTSFLFINPCGIWRVAVRGFFASISASMTRFKAFAPVRAERKAIKTQKIVLKLKCPCPANNMEIRAKDNEKIVCENMTKIP